jgi:hypothetical protein
MNNDGITFFIGLSLGFTIGMGVSFFIDSIYVREIKAAAIEHGYAEYNAVNGEWQWLKKD